MSPRALVSRFLRESRAVAGVEFALIVPFMLALGLGANEMTRYMLVAKRAAGAASAIAQMLSSSSKTLTADEVLNIRNSVLHIPNLARDSEAAGLNYWTVAGVNMSSIVFKPKNGKCDREGCPYEAMVLWSWGAEGRVCGQLQQVADTAAQSRATIPQSLVGPGSVLSVEVDYQYVPVVAAGFIKASRIYRTAYLAPRYLSVVDVGPKTQSHYPLNKCSGV
jgi:hypothetical protein